jgi:hypothetical protein
MTFLGSRFNISMASNLFAANKAIKAVQSAQFAPASQFISKPKSKSDPKPRSQSGRKAQFRNCVQAKQNTIPFEEQLASKFNCAKFIREEDVMENLEVAILINKVLIQSKFF